MRLKHQHARQPAHPVNVSKPFHVWCNASTDVRAGKANSQPGMTRMIDGEEPSAKYKRKASPSTIRPRSFAIPDRAIGRDCSSLGTSIILSCREHAPRIERTFTG